MRVPWNYEEPKCAEVGGDFWFPEKNNVTSNEIVMARSICNSCIHKTECAEWALTYESFGIWGGTTELERKRIRGRKSVKSN